jgi:hypothetical protein
MKLLFYHLGTSCILERFVVNLHYNKVPRWFSIFSEYQVQNSGITFTKGHLERKPFKKEFCTEIKLDGDCCDQDKYENCVLQEFERFKNKTDIIYSALFYNCTSWAKAVISGCKSEACK